MEPVSWKAPISLASAIVLVGKLVQSRGDNALRWSEQNRPPSEGVADRNVASRLWNMNALVQVKNELRWNDDKSLEEFV